MLAESQLQNGAPDISLTKEEILLSHHAPNKDKLNKEVEISRPVYTQQSFDEGFDKQNKKGINLTALREKIKRRCSSLCTAQLARKRVLKFVPFIKNMKSYNVKEDAVGDLISGLTVGIMNIPLAMAYSLLASLPPVYGLYVSFFAPIIYFFFGTSRHISIGTFAIISLIVGNAIESQEDYCKAVAAADPEAVSWFMSQTLNNSTGTSNGTISASPPVLSASMSPLNRCRIGIAGVLTLLVGLIQILLGFARFGFITIYLSDTLVSAFTCGSAYHVVTSQLKFAFGIKVGRFVGAFNLIRTIVDLFSKIQSITWGAFITTIICIAILYVVKFVNERFKEKLKIPIPIELIIVVLTTVISYYAQFNKSFRMDILAEIPAGFPKPVVPPLQKAPELIGSAITLAVISFAINLSIAKLFAKKHNYEIDASQEFIAYGMCNVVCSFFMGFTSSGALSRTALQDTSGGKSQLSGVVSGILILIVLLAIGPYFASLPVCVLAAIIIVALKNVLLQVTELKRLWFSSKYDFAIWLVTFLGVVIIDVDIGLGVGLAFGLLTVVFRSQIPPMAVLGHIPKTDIYKDRKLYPASEDIPGVKIVCVDASLYYANIEHFRKRIYKLTGVNPRKVKAARLKIERLVERELQANEREKKAMEKAAKKLMKSPHSKELPPSVIIQTPELLPARDRPEWQNPEINHIIIDCVMMSYIDEAGVNILKTIYTEYKDLGIAVFLANCKGNVGAMFRSCNIYSTVPEENIYLAVHDAVLRVMSLPQAAEVP